MKMRKKVVFGLMAALVAFSLVFLGCPNGDDEKTVPTPQTVLKVDIPSNVTVAVAALVTPAEMQGGHNPSYVGFTSASTYGTFSLVNSTNLEAWKGTGNYFITLSERANAADPGATYIYMPTPPNASPYTFVNGENTIAWSKFVKITL